MKPHRLQSVLYRNWTVILLAATLIVGVVVLTFQVSRMQSNLAHTSALRSAELNSSALRHFRTLYTSEVISRQEYDR